MKEKGYDFPLHSFQLVSADLLVEDELRYSIAVPQGRLIVRQALRSKGKRVPSALIDRAIADGLAHHNLDVAGFAEHGLDAEWAVNVLHWGAQLTTLEQERSYLLLQKEQIVSLQQGTRRQGRELWARAALAARHAGLRSLVASGAPPRAALRLEAGLRDLDLQIGTDDRAALLAPEGFGAERRAQLLRAIGDLGELHRQALAIADSLRRVSDTLIVVRAGLFGDLCRLCRAAPLVLSRAIVPYLSRTRLFERKGRKKAAQGETDAIAAKNEYGSGP